MPVSYSFSNSVTVDIGYVGGNGSIFNGPVNITAGNINVNSSTFHKKALFNKTSNTTNSFNANTFNDTLDITNSSTAGALFISSNGNNFFNEDIYLSNTGSAGIYFGFSGNTATLAAGKKIYIGSSGFTAGNLAFYKFTQSGSTAQSITTTGTSTVTFGSANATVATFNGAITVSAPNLIFNGSVFNSTLTATKTSSSTNNSTGEIPLMGMLL
ncbi:MAG: hypothetical protein M0D57_10410 [Sphingobacteriales bacterium JAD_PAG50586_3]|nr:MAG: hypothetical protein M0D57_10410 [Sphingobacteriales bacterium JAD_PAG50586_3]